MISRDECFGYRLNLEGKPFCEALTVTTCEDCKFYKHYQAVKIEDARYGHARLWAGHPHAKGRK